MSETEKLDPNHPSRIVELFNELYYYEWTDALLELINKCKLAEEEAIQTLLQITEESYTYCLDISSKRFTNILAELTLWKLAVPNETSSQNIADSTTRKTDLIDFEERTITWEEFEKLHTLLSLPSTTISFNEVDSTLAKIGLNATNLSAIKDMLKSSCEGVCVLVFEKFFKELSSDRNWKKDIMESVEQFLKKCIRISWLMVYKYPPFYLKPSEKRGSKINNDLYRPYTRDGEKVDYCVWPALFLHENGPLLCKGIVQAMAKK